jgi:hypothetical protein
LFVCLMFERYFVPDNATCERLLRRHSGSLKRERCTETETFRSRFNFFHIRFTRFTISIMYQLLRIKSASDRPFLTASCAQRRFLFGFDLCASLIMTAACLHTA